MEDIGNNQKRSDEEHKHVWPESFRRIAVNKYDALQVDPLNSRA